MSLIAVTQQIIIFDARSGGATLGGMAALVIALALAFWLVRIARQKA